MHAAIYFWPESPSQPNFVLMAAHDGQLLAAIGLIVGWVVLGPGRLWVRLLAAPVLVGLWFWPVNWQMQPRDTPGSFVVTMFLCSTAIFLGLRAVGFKVVRQPATLVR